jgi:hypothetical protein
MLVPGAAPRRKVPTAVRAPGFARGSDPTGYVRR